jgi:hypothetical protein
MKGPAAMTIKHGSLLILSLAVTSSAALVAGCGSSGGGGGGAGGSGGAGAACTSNDGGVDPNMISNFEDGLGSVLQIGTPPRNGAWYAYNDYTPTCEETPMAAPQCPDAATTPGPTTHATLNDPTVKGGACNSTYALEFFGSGCTMFQGVGTDLNTPLPPVVDGSAEPVLPTCPGGVVTQPLKVPYDVSGYKAITFWGRTGKMSIPSNQMVQFKMPMLDDTKTTDGGICVDSTSNKCSASFGKFLAFTGAWQQFTLNFGAKGSPGDLSQESWGAVFTWDPTRVVSIQFQPAADSTFDVWIDDVAFVPN